MKNSRSESQEEYVFIRRINDWEIYCSPSKKSLIFKTLSYKPPELELSKEEILGLLKEIDQKG
jgi:hypothetical protein